MTDQTIFSITIPVEADIARFYNEASEADKRKIHLLVNIWLRDITASRDVSLRTLIDQVRVEAQAKGLTQQILEEILSEDAGEALREAMDRMSDEAEANGLTPEILAEILAEDE